MKRSNEILQQLDLAAKKIYINKKELEDFIDIIYHKILFPICCSENEARSQLLDDLIYILNNNLKPIIDNNLIDSKIDFFLDQLSTIQHSLIEDANNYLKNDPAANSLEEVILAYPGFFALAVHRLAHVLHTLEIPIIPRIFSEYAHSKVGIDIHPAATIGKLCYIDHGTGIVIGGTTRIGDNVKIYQGVTLGAMFVEKGMKDVIRHPFIGDNVIIYANATILGGDTNVGHDSVIGGNVWLTKSVEPFSIVYHDSKVNIKKK